MLTDFNPFLAQQRLLNNILPESITEKLLTMGSSVVAEAFSTCSVMFGYIGGLEDLEVTEIDKLDLLQELVCRLDIETTKYRIEKVKTIGSVYMVAAGLPEPLDEHEVELARFAVAFMDIIEGFNAEVGLNLYFKVGMATGCVLFCEIIWEEFAQAACNA